MRKKRNDFDAVGVERMTDAELSKKLGSYQRTESIGMFLYKGKNTFLVHHKI